VRSLLIRLAAAALAFALGVYAPAAWDAAGLVVDGCTEFLLNYQD
jgi:hypothetical protein